MLRRTLIAVAASLAFGAPRTGAQTLASHSDDFGALAALVGSCWLGTFPDGKQTDEHCFEWMLDRRFIRDKHVVRGGKPYAGETIYMWDRSARRLAFWYWNTEGQLMTGRGDPMAEGLVFLTRMPAPGGEMELKATWTPTGPDGFRIWNGQRIGDGWKELWTMDMKRTK
jgi:hypothetical protein